MTAKKSDFARVAELAEACAKAFREAAENARKRSVPDLSHLNPNYPSWEKK